MRLIQRDNTKASMQFYPAFHDAPAAAVIICPGGGYCWLSPREATPVAHVFNQMGLHAFVLAYDVENPPLETRPLADLSWAVAHVRQNAAAFQVDADKIAVCGFSAGGHLTASLGVFWNRGDLFPSASLRTEHRPNAMILCYPVVSSGLFAHRASFLNLAGDDPERQRFFSLEEHVTKDAPPAFIWHTVEDPLVSMENSLLFSRALIAQGVSAELHLFPNGTHGLSLATPEVEEPEKERRSDPHVAQWVALCGGWIHHVLKW